MRRNDIKRVRNLTEREEEIKSGGREDLNPNSFVALNAFVKQEVFDARK